MKGLEFAHAYLYDLLCLLRGIFTKHFSDVEEVLVWLQNENLKANAAKLSFDKTEIDYLGYIVSCEDIIPQPKKIEDIMKIARSSKKHNTVISISTTLFHDIF